MAGRDVEPELLLPGGMYWIVGPTYDLGEKEFRVIWDDMVIGKRLGADKRLKKAYNKRSGEMFIEFPWGTRIEVRSANHPETLVGESLNGVIMSEAAKHHFETWERYIRPALSDRQGWATFPTTPEGHNWLYTLWQLGRNPDYADYASWRFPSWENAVVYPGGRADPEIVLLERTMSPEIFLQEIAADFASFQGKIYGEFDEVAHVKKQTYNPLWPNYIAFDWGFVNPLAAIEFQVDPFDGIHVWREHYKSFTNLDVHLNELRNRQQPEGYKIDMCFGDAADPEAVSFVNQHFGPCIASPDAKTNWRQGVELVKTFLRSYQIGEADEYGTPLEAPKLFVDHNCINLIREFQTYKSAPGTRGLNAKETATKTDDHALDALRYGLMHLFVLGATSRLGDTVSELLDLAPESGYFNLNDLNF